MRKVYLSPCPGVGLPGVVLKTGWLGSTVLYCEQGEWRTDRFVPESMLYERTEPIWPGIT